MITILRNNKSLLRRKSLFRRESGFKRLRNEYRNYAEGRVESKPISQKALSEIRVKIVRQNRRVNLWSTILAIFLFALIIGFTIMLYNNLNHYQLEAEANVMKGKTEKYLFYIEDGDKWLEKGHFNNAIFQYLLAKEIFPAEFNVNYKLVLAYGGKCKYKQSGCTEGQRILNNIRTQFPEKHELGIIPPKIRTVS